MKLTKNKLIETLKRKNEGWTTYQTRKIAKISIRRVNQVWATYLNTGEIPDIGKTNGRPCKQVESWEIVIVKETYEKYRVLAATLEKLIERDYTIHIGHNRIHKIMLSIGLAKKKDKKDVRIKDWIRYERRHSLTAVHIDWYYFSETEEWVFAVIDDASRKILSLIECKSPTTEKSIEGMEYALKHGKIKQCISDHGSQFISNVIDGESRFKGYLESKGIQQILCRIKHPQSNGKVERWFQTYQDHREAFKTKEDFLRWYNDVRPHRSFKFEELETPQMAFVRKMKTEV